MGSFIHHYLIAEKLEMARTLGLVTSYFINPIGPARRPDASVKVWRSPNASDEAIKDYLVRLLHGLVSDDQIVVTTPFVASETIAEAAPRAEPIGGTAVPVAA